MSLFKKKTAIKLEHRAEKLGKSLGVRDGLEKKIKEATIKILKKSASRRSRMIEQVLKEVKPQTPAEYFFTGWVISETLNFASGLSGKSGLTDLLKETIGGIGCGECDDCKKLGIKKTPKILH